MSKLRMIHTQTVRETGNPLISQLPLAKESRSSGPGSRVRSEVNPTLD